MDNKGKQIAKQSAILAVVSVLVRIIGVLYRIPMYMILGKEGMGYYTNAFNIYMYLLIISSYAMPSAISRIVSGQVALKKRKDAHAIFKASIWLNIIISSISAVALFYLAKPYSEFISIPGAEIPIKSLAPSLVIFAVMSSFRGYYQGLHTMVPTALSQVIEQVFNAAFSILLSFLLMSKGLNYGAAGGTIGTGIGALAGLAFLVLVYILYRKTLPKSVFAGNHLRFSAMPKYWKMILMTSIPMVIGTAAFNISTIIDDIMFNRSLAFHNYSDVEIPILSGILNNQYTLIITMPIAIATAIATASIPSISAAMAVKNMEVMREKVKTVIKGSLLIAMPASVGIFVMAGAILKLLFDMGEFEKVTTDILRIGSITVLFFSLSTVGTGILQGLGFVQIPVRSAVKSILIKILFNFMLFYALNLNLYGAAYANIVFSLASAYFNVSAALRKTKLKLNYTEIFWRPLGACLIMAGVTLVSYLLFDMFLPANYWGNLLATIPTILIAMFAYFILIIKLSIVSSEELKAMPLGHKLSALARKFE